MLILAATASGFAVLYEGGDSALASDLMAKARAGEIEGVTAVYIARNVERLFTVKNPKITIDDRPKKRR